MIEWLSGPFTHGGEAVFRNRVWAREQAGTTGAAALAAALESASVDLHGQAGHMRATDHQFQQQLVWGVMDRQGTPGVRCDVAGSGCGFRVVKTIAAAAAKQPTSCAMQRPVQPAEN